MGLLPSARRMNSPVPEKPEVMRLHCMAVEMLTFHSPSTSRASSAARRPRQRPGPKYRRAP